MFGLPTDYLLAYDAGCGPCSRFKAVVDFLDAKGTIGFASLKQAEEVGALETVDPSLRYRSFHLIASGERALSGADALLPLVGLLLPRGGVVSAALEAIPGCRRAVFLGYSALSRLHGSGACRTAAHQ
jgi:predicted DCC family thiol-disulfide oxidoreductase YuxK